MFGPVIEGIGVRLEPLRLDYAPTYIRWLADPAVTRYMLTRHPPSLKKEEEWIEQAATSPESVVWAMIRATDGELIGSIGLHKIVRHDRQGELGYTIGERDQWGKGYGTESIKLATAYAFLELDLHKVWAALMVPNEASRRALEKNGYRQCGLYREDRYAEGRWHDLWVGEILRDEWNRLRETPS